MKLNRETKKELVLSLHGNRWMLVVHLGVSFSFITVLFLSLVLEIPAGYHTLTHLPLSLSLSLIWDVRGQKSVSLYILFPSLVAFSGELGKHVVSKKLGAGSTGVASISMGHKSKVLISVLSWLVPISVILWHILKYIQSSMLHVAFWWHQLTPQTTKGWIKALYQKLASSNISSHSIKLMIVSC